VIRSRRREEGLPFFSLARKSMTVASEICSSLAFIILVPDQVHKSVPMPHSLFTLTLINKAIGKAHNVNLWFTVDAQFETTKQISRCLFDNLSHLGNGLFDPINRVFDQETIVSTTNEWNMRGANNYKPQQLS